MKHTPRFLAALVSTWAALLGTSPEAHAYLLAGKSWPSGTIPMQLQLGSPSSVLSDGSTEWATPAITAFTAWNDADSGTAMVRTKFTWVKDSTAVKAEGNRINNVFFSANVYGDAWDSGVLAVTISYSNSSSRTESDVLFNTGYTWNSYRGNLLSGTYDFQRVALHEFGHIIGLNHPDEATPVQSVSAIMNSRVSNTYTLQADDIAGAKALYGTVGTAPVITKQPTTVSVVAGQPFTLSFTATGTSLTYGWTYIPAGGTEAYLNDGDGDEITTNSYSVSHSDPADSGTYYGFATSNGTTTWTNAVTVTVTAPTGSESTRLGSISTRGIVTGDEKTLIAGFVISGTTAKTVLIRGIGPTLTGFGVANALPNPKIQVINSSTGATVGENDDWSSATNAADVPAVTSRVGGFALTAGSKDAVVLLTDLAPGNYTAIISGVSGSSGVSLVEVYDADATAELALTRKLKAISTRGYIGSGSEVLIAGISISGSVAKRVVIRAVGPGLTKYGVASVNSDPNLRITNLTTGLQVADNDDWYYANQGYTLPSVFNQVGLFALSTSDWDSALVITLPPGNYTATAEGRNSEVGNGLIEVYELP